jgi:hypothetical protein
VTSPDARAVLRVTRGGAGHRRMGLYYSARCPVCGLEVAEVRPGWQGDVARAMPGELDLTGLAMLMTADVHIWPEPGRGAVQYVDGWEVRPCGHVVDLVLFLDEERKDL